MFQYQQQQTYFAQVAGGFDEPAADELRELGAKEIHNAFRGMYFKADQPTLYRINYQARLPARVLAPLITFDCHSAKYLHRTAVRLDWQQLMAVTDTFAVQAAVSATPSLKHSQFAALTVKDAVCDYFREKCGRRPNVDTRNPDLGLHLFVRNNRATISVDVSGGSLHKRGYRLASVAAPLQETLAAAIIRLSGWDGTKPLMDPMCGSGTLLGEAVMHYCRIPAGFLRDKWGFRCLPDYSEKDWLAVKSAADEAIRPLAAGLLSGGDIQRDALRAARRNLAELLTASGTGEADLREVNLSCRDFRQMEKLSNTVIMVNPPYGVRLGERDEAEGLLKEFGDFLKQRCTGCTAFVYVGDSKLLKKVGLKPAWKKELNNGGLEGVLGKFDLY